VPTTDYRAVQLGMAIHRQVEGVFTMETTDLVHPATFAGTGSGVVTAIDTEPFSAADVEAAATIFAGARVLQRRHYQFAGRALHFSRPDIAAMNRSLVLDVQAQHAVNAQRTILPKTGLTLLFT